jgi:hypothetical protein
MMPTSRRSHHAVTREERDRREAGLDDTLEGTFPASDPLSTIPDPIGSDAISRRVDDRL